MKKSTLLKCSIASMGLLFSLNSMSGQVYKVDNHELPMSSEVVNQLSYKLMPSYLNAHVNNSWLLCGHAAFATAMNVLRTVHADDVKQLEWFHNKLMAYPRYKSYSGNPYRESSGDELEDVVNARSDGFSVSKSTTTQRSRAKRNLQNELRSSNTQQIIALTKFKGDGHFVVVHEIFNDPTGTGGGYVKYADPYGGYASKSMGYTKFLNGMRDAGTVGRYSFWIMEK